MRLSEKGKTSTFISRDAATSYCLKSKGMAVTPVLINGVKAAPANCAALQNALVAKQHQIMSLPLVADFLFNVVDAAQVVRSEVKRASPLLREFQEVAKEIHTVAGGNVRVPLFVRQLQRTVAQAVQNHAQQQSQDEESSFDSSFVHPCHECDNCQEFPIRGHRWRAMRPKLTGTLDSTFDNKEVKLPDTATNSDVEMNFDLCHPCYMKWRATGGEKSAMMDLPSSVKFFSTQLGR
jgi:hypothetical protein